MSSLADQLFDLQGVTSIRVTERWPGVEDLYVTTDGEDVIIWHNARVGTSLVLVEHARLEGVPDSKLVALVELIAAGEYDIDALETAFVERS